MSSDKRQKSDVDVNAVIERLKKYANVVHDSDLSIRLGLTKTAVNQWRTRKAINWRKIESIFPELSLDYLRTGDGNSVIAERQAILRMNEPIARYSSRARRAIRIIEFLELKKEMLVRILDHEELYNDLEQFAIKHGMDEIEFKQQKNNEEET